MIVGGLFSSDPGRLTSHSEGRIKAFAGLPIPSKIEGFMATDPPTHHLRMPLRADAVAGVQPQPGEPTPAKLQSDPRTDSQDPTLAANQIIGSKT
jgi:hypothetical protein